MTSTFRIEDGLIVERWVYKIYQYLVMRIGKLRESKSVQIRILENGRRF